MATDLSGLTASVAEVKTVAGSAAVLLDGLKAALDAAGTDPAALAALSASLSDTSGALVEAIVRNTPAVTEPPVEVPPVEVPPVEPPVE